MASNPTIATLVNSSARSVQNALTNLEECKYLRRAFNGQVREIVPLVRFGHMLKEVTTIPKFASLKNPLSPPGDSGKRGGVTKSDIALSPGGDHSYIDSREEQQVAPAAQVFSLKEEVRKMKHDPQRHIQLIGEYLEERKVEIRSQPQLTQAIRRHCRAAVALAQFEDDQIGRATKKAEREYPKAWTLETLVKILTR